MRHRPEYIAVSSPYVRSATYAPPSRTLLLADAQDAADLANPISRWAAAWRSLAFLVLVLAALTVFLGAFAYGVHEIVAGTSRPTSSTWVTPTPYGPPVGTPR